MKNTHLQHPEDSILTGDLSALDWLLSDGEISAKIDGVAETSPTNPRYANPAGYFGLHANPLKSTDFVEF